MKLNAYAETLLNHPAFTIPSDSSIYTVMEVTAESIGFNQGASLPEILKEADALEYGLCPLGLAPFF